MSGAATPTATVVVQARMGSTRLPGKVGMPFGGRPMLGFQLARLATVADHLARLGVDLAGLVVATSTLERDEPVAAIALDAGVAVHRGPEDDVLERVAAAVDAHPADHVVRLTADCPWTDPALVAQVVGAHIDLRAAYTSNTLLRSWPDGLDVEVLSAAALADARIRAASGPEREHVTPYVQRHPERHRLVQVVADEPLGDLRWTVDTEDDLAALAGPAGHEGAVTSTWQALRSVLPASRLGPDDLRLRPAVSGTSEVIADGTPGARAIRRWAIHRGISEIGGLTVEVAAGGQATASGTWPRELHAAVASLMAAALAADAQVVAVPALPEPLQQNGPR